MASYKFGDIVKEVKINIDRNNNPYEFYVAGDHMDSEDLTIHRKGIFASDDVGPAFTRLFKPGQVLYGSRRTYLKKVAVADFEGICSNTTFVLEGKAPDKFDERLLPFIMLSDGFTQWSVSHSKGSTNPYILFSDLASYEFELPTMEKQRKLADKLWSAYHLKEAYQKLLSATDEMVKSQFLEMTSSCDDSCKLSDLVELPIKAAKKQYKGLDTINYIDISSIDDGSKTFSNSTEYLFMNAPSRAQQCVMAGDILYSTVRPNLQNFGIITTQNENLVASSGFCVLRPKTGLHNFIMAVISSNSFTAKMVDKAQGGVFPAVNPSFILEQEIPYPPEETIHAISSIVQQADKSKFELKRAIEAIDKVIKSLING